MRKNGVHDPYVEVLPEAKSNSQTPTKSPLVQSPLDSAAQSFLYGIVLEFASIDHILPQISTMVNLAKKKNTFGFLHEEQLSAMIEEHEKQIRFNTSNLNSYIEKIIIESRTERITPLANNPGILLLTSSSLYFQPFRNFESLPVLSVALEDIHRIERRRYILRNIGLEITLKKNSTVKTCNDFFDKLSEHVFYAHEGVKEMTQKWQKREIDNFTYLMYLNHASGRTKNDLTQYPVFPWVISNYTNKTLDLTDPSNFRDLSKPMGALNPDRLKAFRKRMAEMPDEKIGESMGHSALGAVTPKFLYGTHYSTPGYVLYYMVRKYPEYMLRLQNGKFDVPARTFSSLQETWLGVTTNPTDVKELIPEFYEDPKECDFLVNKNHLVLGQKESEPIDDVVLPPWAQSPQDFIQQCRNALESEYVSEHLHEWIDLIFGYKQKGQEAIKADNLFFHMTYEGAVDIEKISDPIEKRSVIAQIKEFGQCPRQLFSTPHPRRNDSVLENENKTEMILDTLKITLMHSAPLIEWGSITSLTFQMSFKLHKDNITNLALSRDGKKMFSTSEDSTLAVFDVDQKKLLSTTKFEMSLSSVQAVDDDTVMVGCWDNNIYVYSISETRVIDMHHAHDDGVSALAFSAGQNILLSGCWDGSIRVWKFNGRSSKNILDREPLADFDEDAEIEILQVDPATHSLACAGTRSGTLVIIDLVKLEVQSVPAHEDVALVALAFTPDGTRVVTGAADGTVKIWDLGGILQGEWNFAKLGGVVGVASDGKWLLVAGSEGAVSVNEIATRKEVVQVKSKDAFSAVVVPPAATDVVLGCANGALVLYSINHE